MDAATQLALMTKAKQVFENGGTYLSFPVTPLSFKKPQLNLLDEANLNGLIDFSSLVNFIPSGVAWQPTETNHLWDVYAMVLQEAHYAVSTRTPDEEADYQAARNFLNATGSDGLIGPSLALLTYRTCRDEYLLAQQQYLAAKGTADASSDPDERQQWIAVTEPQLRRVMSDAQARWDSEGQRNEVEQAQAKLRLLGARSPLASWQEWRDRFNPDVDTLTRAQDQLSVFPTSYSPINALDDASWRLFTVSGPELATLWANAGDDVRYLLGDGQTTSDIESIQFEFSSASLVRPWFSPDAFAAHFWRFDDASRVISDGASPAHGMCPSYPVAVIFARSIRVKSKSVAPATAGDNSGFQLSAAALQRSNVIQVNYRVAQRAVAPTVAPVSPEALHVTRDMGVAQLNRVRVPMAQMAVTQVGAAALLRQAPVAQRVGGLDMQRAVEVNTMPGVTSAPSAAQTRNEQSLRALRSVAFTRAPLLGGGVAVRPVDPVAQPSVDDSIFIFAFICRPVPKCPDPDSSLQW